jgi:hypothetical protein
VRRLDVVDHQLEPLDRAGRRVDDAGSERDRAPRARGRELHEPDLVVHLVVVIGVETELLGVERLGAVDIRDRYGDELELPVHALSFLSRGG